MELRVPFVGSYVHAGSPAKTFPSWRGWDQQIERWKGLLTDSAACPRSKVVKCLVSGSLVPILACCNVGHFQTKQFKKPVATILSLSELRCFSLIFLALVGVSEAGGYVGEVVLHTHDGTLKLVCLSARGAAWCLES